MKVAENKINFYTGRVVDNDDPNREGRCKIRVFGKYTEEIPDEDLPWATPDFNFIGSSMGSFVVPPNDALVKVYFDNDDFYNPRYTTKVFNRNSTKFSAGIDEDYPNTMVFYETDNGDYFKINRQTNEATFRHASGLLVNIDSRGNIELNTKNTEVGIIELNTSDTDTSSTLLYGDKFFTSLATFLTTLSSHTHGIAPDPTIATAADRDWETSI